MNMAKFINGNKFWIPKANEPMYLIELTKPGKGQFFAKQISKQVI